jgi:hypothetical protein
MVTFCALDCGHATAASNASTKTAILPAPGVSSLSLILRPKNSHPREDPEAFIAFFSNLKKPVSVSTLLALGSRTGTCLFLGEILWWPAAFSQIAGALPLCPTHPRIGKPSG